MIDPRYYQLLVQTILLFWGMLELDFTVTPIAVISVIGTAWLIQTAFTRIFQLNLNLLSATNTALSILLLLHADTFGWHLLAVLIAIASKFLLTWKNRHIFNPSNLGIVATILMVPSAWTAPGQWGHTLWLLLITAGIGLIAIIGIRHMLSSLSFLAIYASLILLYAFWLGDPLPVPVHQLQNGVLLIFAFFMLSDPMTIPLSPPGQLIYGSWVAVVGWTLQITLHVPNAFLYALVFSSPTVLLINRYIPGRRFSWPAPLRSHS